MCSAVGYTEISANHSEKTQQKKKKKKVQAVKGTLPYHCQQLSAGKQQLFAGKQGALRRSQRT